MSKWNRVLLCASLCFVLGAGVFACKKDEEADYGDNAAATTEATEMTTEAPATTEAGTEMSTDMSTDMSTGT